MSGEVITTAQVLQALSGLGDKVSSAFDAIEALAGKTPDPAPTSSSSSKKTAKAPENFDGSIEGGHAFLRELYLYLYGKPFTDEKKITIALSFLCEGDAAEWRDQAVEAIEANEAALERV